MTKAGGIAGDQLRAFVERIERLIEEKQEVADGIKAVFAEAKANGFDTKAMRRVIAIRKQGESDWAKEQAVLDTYLHALGMEPGGLLDPARMEAAQ